MGEKSFYLGHFGFFEALLISFFSFFVNLLHKKCLNKNRTQDQYSTIKKLGYAPKVIASSHWIFEYELGELSEIAEFSEKNKVKVNLYDIYGRLFDETLDINVTHTGIQRLHISFEGTLGLRSLLSTLSCNVHLCNTKNKTG